MYRKLIIIDSDIIELTSDQTLVYYHASDAHVGFVAVDLLSWFTWRNYANNHKYGQLSLIHSPSLGNNLARGKQKWRDFHDDVRGRRSMSSAIRRIQQTRSFTLLPGRGSSHTLTWEGFFSHSYLGGITWEGFFSHCYTVTWEGFFSHC